ncbi:hypothetical protein V1478_010743 [Vespula squamosa]|uniref:Uncharacterized protein n=1 Tax=Vespula squamosa TaxID=30214 RepID=A0ABD2AF75_VESSQ
MCLSLLDLSLPVNFNLIGYNTNKCMLYLQEFLVEEIEIMYIIEHCIQSYILTWKLDIMYNFTCMTHFEIML